MEKTVLYVGRHLPTEVATAAKASGYRLVCANSEGNPNIEGLADHLPVDIRTVEGRARLIDWLRQNVAPAHILCELHPFDFSGGDNESGSLSASDYLQGQIVGITELLEAAVSLNPACRWRFISPDNVDVWSRASEAYFRVLLEGLVTLVPSADFDFMSQGDAMTF